MPRHSAGIRGRPPLMRQGLRGAMRDKKRQREREKEQLAPSPFGGGCGGLERNPQLGTIQRRAQASNPCGPVQSEEGGVLSGLAHDWRDREWGKF